MHLETIQSNNSPFQTVSRSKTTASASSRLALIKRKLSLAYEYSNEQIVNSADTPLNA